MSLPGCFEPPPTAASMAICRPEASDAPVPRAGAQRRMAVAGLSWFPRGMAGGQGKKVAPPPLRLRRSRCQPSFGQIKPLRGRVAARRTACTGEDLAGVGCRAQEAQLSRREGGSRGAQIGQAATHPNHGACEASVHRCCRLVGLGPTSRSCARAVSLPRQAAVLVTRRFPARSPTRLTVTPV
jgi:hypothetical protein